MLTAAVARPVARRHRSRRGLGRSASRPVEATEIGIDGQSPTQTQTHLGTHELTSKR